VPKSQTSNPGFRLDYIDGLRGLAVSAVVIFHSAIWAGLPEGHFRNFLGLGRPGVDLFLVISGFCLFWPHARAATGKVPALEPKKFFHRRIRRIFPPFYAACLLTLAVCYVSYRGDGKSWWGTPFQNFFPWQGLVSWENLGVHALLLHGFSNSYAHSIDGAFWSLSLEWQFYLLFPLLVWLCRKSLVVGFLVPFIVTLSFRLAAHWIDPVWLHTYVGNENCFGRWAEFDCGVIAAAAVAWNQGLFSVPMRFLKPVFRIYGSPFFAGSAVFFAAVLEVLRPSNFVAPLVWGIAFGSLIVCAAGQIKSNGTLVRFLETRTLVWIGTISYSIYLLHGAIFQLLALWVSNTSISLHGRELIFMIFGPVIIAFLSYLFFMKFERPFMSLPAKKSASDHLSTMAVQKTEIQGAALKSLP
jgi:peptidoglycan/LPS O-acetylase OafA/YrhL